MGLRILILSTPKTGNTWLRHLLAGVYRLPQFLAPPPLSAAALDQAGESWVTHYHIRPNPELLAWIRENRPVVITTIRHPGDVLLSLYHHIHDFQSAGLDPDFLRSMLSAGFVRRGMESYAEDRPFYADLDCSLDWMSCPGSLTVRYEDLRTDPVAALRALTDQIQPAPLDRIEAAVEMCHIDLMRRLAGDKFAAFFRQGKVGGWRDELPSDVIEMLRTSYPYAAQLARLGYSMDAVHNTGIVPRPRHPMTTIERFDNGVRVAPLLVQCFFWANFEHRTGWEKQLDSTRPGSFYDWLNAPAPIPAAGIYRTLPLSNIAAFLYQQRPDLRLVYKDLSSVDRLEYVRWFLWRAGTGPALDRAFVDRQRAYLLEWANSPAGADTNFVTHICQSRINVLAEFPHIQGVERRSLIRAVVRAAKAMKLERAYINPLEASLGRHWVPARIRRWCGMPD